MSMARQPVAKLWVDRQGGGALVHVGAAVGAESTSLQTRSGERDRGDLLRWVDRSSVPAGAMVFGGLGLAGLGLLLASLFGAGTLMMAAALSSMLTLGGGLTFLGLLKQRRAGARRELPPAAEDGSARPRTDPTVLRERARRVHHVLGELQQATFEALLARLRWTEAALLETLVEMKEAGTLEEDLDLDTGEWVYRPQYANATGTAASMMLEERAARASAEQ